MGNHVAEVVGLPSVQAIKVHRRMCSELLQLVRKISKIFPELEEARPRCLSGIESLSLLNETILSSTSLLQRCCESSVLYLALTGEATLCRCKKYRNLFDQGLSQIQTMVPVLLADKISGIIAHLKITEFCLDPSEAEAGKILQELLHKSNNTNGIEQEAALTAIHDVSSRLRIVSQKALLIEKRSIKKMIDNFAERERERGKRRILIFFLDLLKKYGKSLPLEQKVNALLDPEQPLPFASPYRLSREVEFCMDYRPDEAQIGMLSRAVPPEEFICPLSLKLMYNPVVIASGQTCERMWIEKWFKEGNDTCPKTQIKLPNMSYTSNVGMKNLIEKWCAEHGVSILDPQKIQETLSNPSWETSSNSIASITSSLYNLNLPVDFSNVSLGSYPELDHSNTEFSRTMPTLHEDDMELLSKFGELPWDSRCNAVEDVKNLLKRRNESQLGIPLEMFAQLILRFLKDAYDHCDVAAQMAGCELLLEFVQKDGDGAHYIKNVTYNLLASFLETNELAQQALSILEVLSSHKQCFNNITSSAVTGILNILDNQIRELLEPALHVLSNLSSNGDVTSFIAPTKVTPKLVPLFEDETLVGHCMTILKNVWCNENSRLSTAETRDYIALIVRVLEIDNQGAQENALSILLPLCLQCIEYCQLVMDAGILTNLLSILVNGSDGAKAAAKELMRILRDVIGSGNESCCSKADPVIEGNWSKPDNNNNRPKATGFLGKVFGKKKK